MSSVDYVLLLGIVAVPLMVVIYRLMASMMFLWQILAATWMSPL